MPVRETYDLPRRPPFPFRMFAVMAALPVASLVLWLVFPDEPVFVALLAVTVIAAVGFGVWKALSWRALERPPGREEQHHAGRAGAGPRAKV